jgi:hypothetical protein
MTTARPIVLLMIIFALFRPEVYSISDPQDPYPYQIRNVDTEYLGPVKESLRGGPRERRSVPQYRIIGHEFSLSINISVTDESVLAGDPPAFACYFRGDLISEEIYPTLKEISLLHDDFMKWYLTVRIKESGWLDCLLITPKETEETVNIRTATYVSNRVRFYLGIP